MKIICIGRNYKNHAKELGNDIPKEPLFFLKPDTAIQPKGHPFFIPDFSNEIHHEIEIILKVSKNGKHINQKFAHNYFQEIGLGIDFTARDIQEN
jgi:2-keto-4-pentenoate hydratase/2-oxohepta-3-ene-1,7-dioic acid hydratase in catechol pathway